MRRILAGLTVLSLASISLAQDKEKPAVDIVFCIDCSGSMQDVIDTAKQKVWAIVNETAKLRPAPNLRIGLIGYGNAEGPFRTFDLSDDLDTIYKNLMTFNDKLGGSEYVGLAIQRATDLKWAEGDKALKVIYVVGNETARQGPVDYTVSAPQAINKGIVVNAIYCGDYDYQTAPTTWREIARLADGQYMEIAGNGGMIAVNTPYDEQLVALNQKLNATYLGYGKQAAEGAANQVGQDSGALALSRAAFADRVVAKGGAMYGNARWDLVDASKQADFDITKIKDEDLPEEIRKLDPAKRAEFVQNKAKERTEVQTQIKEISDKRDKIVQEEIKKQGLAADKSLDEAVKQSITEQAKRKGFEFEPSK
jgi:hypothetical protein